MVEYNASDTKSIRRAAKAAKAAEGERQGVIFNLMSSPAGRTYMYDRLVRANIFSTTFTTNPYASAFNEGQRNLGLQDLNDIMQFAPDQYVQMMREANDRRSADDNRQSGGRGANGSGDDSRPVSEDTSGTVSSDYEPGDEDRVE
jgi:hypothetical protein